MEKLNILGVAGSLRKDSYNRSALMTDKVTRDFIRKLLVALVRLATTGREAHGATK